MPNIHFGSRDFGKVAPEVAYDTEVSSNVVGIGFIWPDRSIEIIRSDFDQALSSDAIDRIKSIINNHVAYGFNSEGYDVAIVAALVAGEKPSRIKLLSDLIINGRGGKRVFPTTAIREFGIPAADYLQSIDLMGAVPRNTSLKAVGISLGFDPVELPFDPNLPLTVELADKVFGEYLRSDLTITAALRESRRVEDALTARETLDSMYGTATLSLPDARVAEAVVCAEYERMTGSDRSEMKAVCATFHQEPFKVHFPNFSKLGRSDALQDWKANCLAATYTASESGNVPAPEGVERMIRVGDINITFALGGMHSIDAPGYFEADGDSHLVISDVVSFYPSMMSKYSIKPRGLGIEFAQIVTNMLQLRLDSKKQVKELRQRAETDPAAKAEMVAAKARVDSLKVPLNALFGKTGQPFSPVYDRAATTTITLTGQFLLGCLIHMVSEIDGVSVLSANTDGIVCRVAKGSMDQYQQTCAAWEVGCGMTLETEYLAKYVRDSINEYIAVDVDGKVKTKGKLFNAEPEMGKTASFRVVPYLIREYVVNGRDPEEAVRDEALTLDHFLHRRKVTKGALFGEEPIGVNVKAYPSLEPQPDITSRPNAKGTCTRMFSGCRALTAMPSGIPDDLDRDAAVQAACSAIRRFSARVVHGRNDLADSLKALGWRLCAVREDGSRLSESASKGFNFDMGSIAIALGKKSGDRQVLSINLIEQDNLEVDGWIVESGDCFAGIVRLSTDQIDKYQKLLRSKKSPGGFALAHGAYVIEGEGRTLELTQSVPDASEVPFPPPVVASDARNDEEVANAPSESTHTASDDDSAKEAVTPSTNLEFIKEVLGIDWERAFLVSNTGAPDHPDPSYRSSWIGGPPVHSKDLYLDPDRGNFLCCSTFRQRDDESWGREVKNFDAMHWVLLDDIGGKVGHPSERGFGPATWEIETSPGNFQFGFKLGAPEKDPARAGAFMQALVRSEGITDTSAGEVNRLGRLPYGTNHKLKLGKPFSSKLVAWRPDVTYTLDDLATTLGIPDLDALAERFKLSMNDNHAQGEPINPQREGLHPIIGAFSAIGAISTKQARIKGNTLVVDVLCPWHEDHSHGDTSGSALLIRSDGTWKYRCHHECHSGRKILNAGQPNERAVLEYGSFAVTEFFKARQIRVPGGNVPYQGSTFAASDYGHLVNAARQGGLNEVVNEDGGEVVRMDFFEDVGSYAELISSHGRTGSILSPNAFNAGAGEAERLEPVHEVPANQIPPIEYVIDGLIANKLTIFAGPAGIGKTNMMMPLALAVAGAIDPDRVPVEGYNVKVTLRRRVVYLTEEVDQIDRCKYAFYTHLSTLTIDEFAHWFNVIPSKRMSPNSLAREIARVREEYAYVSVDHGNFKIEPLIILDTSNANLDLNNENDNAEVGKAVAAIKQSIGAGSCWLICHTKKDDSKGDIFDYSIRGAGAFIGDANATVYLGIIDGLEGRHLKLGKCRFATNTTECTFATLKGAAITNAPWGESQVVEYLYTVPTILNDGELKTMKLEAKEEAKVAAEERKADDQKAKFEGRLEIILGRLRKRAEECKDDPWLRRSKVTEGIHCRDQKDLLDNLIESGSVIKESRTEGRQKVDFYSISDRSGYASD